MSEYNPPREILTVFNPDDFLLSSSTLTQEAGDARYLKLAGGTEAGPVIFATGLSSSDAIKSSVGTALLPSYTFTGDLDTGIFSSDPNSIDLTAGGVRGLQVNASYVRSHQTLGSVWGFESDYSQVNNPAFRFTSDPSSGMYSIGAGNVGISCSGVKSLDISTTAVSPTLPIRLIDGNASTPALSFGSTTNTGLYSTAPNNLYLSSGGTLAMTWGSTINASKALRILGGGSTTTTTCGFNTLHASTATTAVPYYWSYFGAPAATGTSATSGATVYIAGAITGTEPVLNYALQVASGITNLEGGVQVGNGTVSLPSIAFTADDNTGLYRIGSNNIGFTCNGANRFDVSDTSVNCHKQILCDYQSGSNYQIRLYDALGSTFAGTIRMTDNGGIDDFEFMNSSSNLSRFQFRYTNNGGLTIKHRSGSNSASAFQIDGYTGAAFYNALNVATSTTNGQMTVLSDAVVTTPSYSFVSDVTTGLYRIGAGNIGIACSGIKQVDISTTATTFGKVVYINYQSGINQMAFQRADLTYTLNMYLDASNYFYIKHGTGNGRIYLQTNIGGTTVQGSQTTNSSTQFTINGSDGTNYRNAFNVNTYTLSAGVSTAGNLSIAPANDPTLPSYTFIGDLTTGLYRIGAGNMGLSCSGVKSLDISTTALTSTVPYIAPVGAVGAPSLSFTGDLDSGFYWMSSGKVGYSANGVEVASIGASSFTLPGISASNVQLTNTLTLLNTNVGNGPTIGNYVNSVSLTASTTIPVAEVGKTLQVYNNSAGTITITRSSSDVINGGGLSAQTSMTILAYTSVSLFSTVLGSWNF